jgi:hypothetical protein
MSDGNMSASFQIVTVNTSHTVLKRVNIIFNIIVKNQVVLSAAQLQQRKHLQQSPC